jgi:RNAse (barnase) inhibitor barstar
MNGIELGMLLADPSQAGAYFVDARERGSLVEAGNMLHFAVLPVDLRTCMDIQTAMGPIAEALSFPDWFGENLDALADCLNDLSWLPSRGYLLLIEHSGDWRAQEPETFQSVLDILNESATRWAQDRVPLWALVLLPSRELGEINA